LLSPVNLLDKLCLEGVGLAFAHQVCSDVTLEDFVDVPAVNWFERNKHYLWQELQGFCRIHQQMLPTFILTGQKTCLIK